MSIGVMALGVLLEQPKRLKSERGVAEIVTAELKALGADGSNVFISISARGRVADELERATAGDMLSVSGPAYISGKSGAPRIHVRPRRVAILELEDIKTEGVA